MEKLTNMIVRVLSLIVRVLSLIVRVLSLIVRVLSLIVRVLSLIVKSPLIDYGNCIRVCNVTLCSISIFKFTLVKIANH